MVSVIRELYCTKHCGAEYPRFCGTATMAESWVVGPDGSWEETIESETISEPNSQEFTCANCGASARWHEVPNQPRAVPESAMTVWVVVLGDGDTYDLADSCELIEIPQDMLAEIQNDSKLLREAESRGWKVKPLDY